MHLTSSQQKDNCLKLADILEQFVTDEQFDMSNYGRGSNHCGTVGCALGWGCMSGLIDGLAYSAFDRDTGEYITQVKGLHDNISVQPVYADPDTDNWGDTECNWMEAGDRFFGYDANMLFTRGYSGTRSEIADQLRRIAAR